jgi:NitT/TauT family transport system substrate-binding protein
MTIYRSGAECFEALAAGAADIILDPPALVAAGLRRGVAAKLVAGAQDAYDAIRQCRLWVSLPAGRWASPPRAPAPTCSPAGRCRTARWISRALPAAAAGSCRTCARATSMRSRNLDAAVICSPLTFPLMRATQARSLIDYTAAMPRHCVAGWIVPDRMIAERPALVQASVNALYGGLAWRRANRDGAVALIAENNEIPAEVAPIAYEETILKLLTDGRLGLEEIRIALALSERGGMTSLAPAEETFTTRFEPVPTAA